MRKFSKITESKDWQTDISNACTSLTDSGYIMELRKSQVKSDWVNIVFKINIRSENNLNDMIIEQNECVNECINRLSDLGLSLVAYFSNVDHTTDLPNQILLRKTIPTSISVVLTIKQILVKEINI